MNFIYLIVLHRGFLTELIEHCLVGLYALVRVTGTYWIIFIRNIYAI
jgi:hypothetical protein